MAVQHRTFVKLDGHEKKIVDNLRRLLRKPDGKLPRRSAVIKGVIRDYWRRLEQDRRISHASD